MQFCQRGHDGGILQLLGDVPLAIAKGLLADVAVRHLGEVGLGDLDVIAEYFVKADLEAFDAGGFPLRGGAYHQQHFSV